jgi:DNA-binding transcriptional regulator YiaG
VKKTKRIVRAEFGSDGRLREVGTGRVIVPRFDPKRARSAAAAKPDADTPKLTKRELAELRPVDVASEIDVAAIRRKLNLSQSVFASQFGITLAVLRDWEQGRRKPDATARAYLKVVVRQPEVVRRILLER